MRVLYLVNRIPWFGAHTGYEFLPAFAGAEGISAKTYSPSRGLISRAVGKAISTWRGHGSVSQGDAAVRLRIEFALQRDPDCLAHILYGDAHVPFWGDAPEKLRRRALLTFHQPSFLITLEKAAALHRLPNIVVLWQREMDWFRNHLGNGRIHFIPHGVDTDFFSPAPDSAGPSSPPRLLYVGVHLRNTEMLARLIPRLHRERPELQFDLLVPEHRRSEPGLARLVGQPNVNWHAKVDDEGLRRLYRSARFLLLPLDDSGANTAVVEALACGLPVVTTDVGGIRDYGGGTVYSVVHNNDDEGMLALINRYLDDRAQRDEVSRRSRQFAEETLAWPVVMRRHLQVYREVLS